MKKSISTLVLAAAALSIPAQAQDFFPLETGNRWVYRGQARWSNQRLTIEVGDSRAMDGRTYYEVTGYAPGTILVRRGENGSLYVREDDGVERLLTRFGPGESYETSLAGTCRLSATPQSERANHRMGGTGREFSALVIRYRTLNCADAGIEEELYVENVGLVRRTVTTIAGPVTYELLESSTGGASVDTLPGSSFQLRLESREYPLPEPTLRGTLRLRVAGTGPLTLEFPSSQRYDLALVDPNGRRVAAWSADKLFLQLVAEVKVEQELSFTFEFPIHGGSLFPGDYTLEGWLTTSGERVFSTKTTVKLTGITNQ